MTIFLLISNILLAQDKDSLINEIRIHFNQIKKDINSYDTTMIQIWDESTESGQITAYYDNLDLKLIEVVFLYEIGKHKIEYYFNDGKLIFAFDQDFEYNRPIYWN